MSKQSIEDLQVKIAFLEEAIQTLSDEYYQQQRELDEIKLTLQGLVDKMRAQGSESTENADYADEKPPHY